MTIGIPSAGVSAGIDLALQYIAAEAGDDAAGKVQFASEYDPSSTRFGAHHVTPLSAPACLKSR
jgi:transcriptional regulator GlxA family with amidase domain